MSQLSTRTDGSRLVRELLSQRKVKYAAKHFSLSLLDVYICSKNSRLFIDPNNQ